MSALLKLKILNMKKLLLVTIFVAIAIVATLSGCAERRYYHRYRHHSPEYITSHGAVIINEKK